MDRCRDCIKSSKMSNKKQNDKQSKTMSEDNSAGYVYILTNPSFKADWVKIGKSKHPVDVRSKQLDNTAVPLPFEIYATLKTKKYNLVEKQIHKQIDRLTDLRIRQNREFFNIPPTDAFDIMCDVADLLDDSVLTTYVMGKPAIIYDKENDETLILDDTATKKKRTAKEPFKFHMVDISIGEKVVFDPLDLEVKVASDNKIEYEGRLWSLSAFTAEFLPEEERCASNTYQGPKYFSYYGEKLSKLREEQEKYELSLNQAKVKKRTPAGEAH